MATVKKTTTSKSTSSTKKPSPELCVHTAQLMELKNVVNLLEQIRLFLANSPISEANSIPSPSKPKNEASESVLKPQNKAVQNKNELETILLDVDSKIDTVYSLVLKQVDRLDKLDSYIRNDITEILDHLMEVIENS